MKQPENLILASGSPRRQTILKEAGINFSVVVKNTPEDFSPEIPVKEVPAFLAAKKALPFLPELKDEVVLTADTVVIIDNIILGKPENYDHAFQMLRSLSGRMHQVVTGVCVLSRDRKEVFSDLSEVYFKSISDEDIHYYLKTFKPFDKAGAYGIQEWIGYVAIERINGSFYNVMGLPVHKVVEVLKSF